MMKILFASHTGVFTGGAEKSMLFLAIHASKKHDVSVNIPDGNKDYIKELSKNHLRYSEILKDRDKQKFSSIINFNSLVKILRRIRYVYRFYNYVKKLKPDIVYLNTIRTVSELVACKLAGIKTVMHLRGFDDKSHFRSYFLKLNNRVIGLNHYAKKVISNYVNDQNKIFIIPNGTTINPIFEKKVNYANLSFCVISPYNYRKGTDNLYYFLKELEKTNLKFKVHHFGKSEPEDDYSYKFLKKINKLNIDFKEHGYTTNNELVKLLNNINFLILPSRREGLSRAYLESIERGVIPILSDIDEHKELIDLGGSIGLNFKKNMNISNLISIINNKNIENSSLKCRSIALEKFDLNKVNSRIINIMINA